MTAPEPTADDPAAVDPAEQEDVKPKASAEAARYRRQLRDTETERDGLRERVVGYERAEAQRLAADVLVDGSDLWAAGVQLDDLRDDDGNLDPAKVTAAVEGIVEQRPHWARPTTPRPDPRQGGGQQDVGRWSWSDAIRDRDR